MLLPLLLLLLRLLLLLLLLHQLLVPVAARLRPLLNLAGTLPASVIFDMEQADTKELIHSIFMRLFMEEPYRTFPHAGIALQAYRTDTYDDVQRLLTWSRERLVPVTIRLVKGASPARHS